MTILKKTILSLFISIILTGVFYGTYYIYLSNTWEFLTGATILATLFFTLFLIIFFLFNVRQDPVIIIKNRLRHLHISLIEHIYEHKDVFCSQTWSKELEQRRRDIITQLKQGIKIGSGEERDRIDALIHNSWDELVKHAGGSKDKNGEQDNLEKTGKQGLLSRAAAVLDDPAESEELEVVSPFSDLLRDFSKDGIIEEREGIPYVNEDALKSKGTSSKTINRDFKDLVDSVIKN
ncbi:MAG: hypothetical protein FWG77_02585 [Treponema sp.]|nr:hypothetical protein [Treponema sp.]